MENLPTLQRGLENRLISVKGPIGECFHVYNNKPTSLKKMKLQRKESFVVPKLQSIISLGEKGLNKTLIEIGGFVENVSSAFSAVTNTSASNAANESEVDKRKVSKVFENIRIGDFVSLYPVAHDTKSTSIKHGNYMMTDSYGMMRSFISLQDEIDIQHPMLHVYEICSVAQEYSNNSADLDDASLGIGTNENKEGDSENEKELGNILRQNDVFTLRTALSKLYLAANPGQKGDIDKDCVRLGVSHDKDNVFCHFKLRNRFGWDSVNNPIYYEQQVSIVNIATNLVVQVGNLESIYFVNPVDMFSPARQVEVGLVQADMAEFDRVTWRIHFHSRKNAKTKNDVMIGEHVSLHHTVIDGYLWGSCNSKLFDRPPYGPTLAATLNTYDILTSKPVQFALGEIYGKEKTIFEIENLSRMSGGYVKWHQPFRLRHVATGCYVCVVRDVDVEDDRSGLQSAKTYRTVMCRPYKGLIRKSKKYVDFFLSSIFRFSPSTKASSDCICWDNPFVTLEHMLIPAPEKIDGSSEALLYYVANYIRHHNGINVVSLSVGATKPRVRKMYPSLILDSLCAKSQKYARTMHSDGNHKTEVVFVSQPSESDLTKLVKSNFYVGLMCAHGYFYRTLMQAYESAIYNIYLEIRKLGKKCKSKQSTLNVTNLNKSLRDIASSMINVLTNFISWLHTSSDYEREYLSGQSNIFMSQATGDMLSFVNSERMKKSAFRCNGFLTSVFHALRCPESMGLTFQDCCIWKDFEKINNMLYQLIYCMLNENPQIQDFIARSSFSGWRASSLITDSLIVDKPSTPDLGYWRHFFVAIDGPHADRSTCLILNGLCKNRFLLDILLSEADIIYIIKLLRKNGPSQSLLGLLAELAVCSDYPIFSNQEILLRTLYSSDDNIEFIENRLTLLVETKLLEGQSDQLSSLSQGSSLVISWHGSPSYRCGDNAFNELYYDYATLGLTAISENVPKNFLNYLEKAGIDKESKWVKLEDIAWTIDPLNCCEFWKGNAEISWSQYAKALYADSNLLAMFEKRQIITQHYLGVLNIFVSITSKRNYLAIWEIEQQFSYELLLCAIKDKKIPNAFKRAFLMLMHNLYIDRFPNYTQRTPSTLRLIPELQSVSDFDEAYGCFNYNFLQDPAVTNAANGDATLFGKFGNSNKNLDFFLQAAVHNPCRDKHRDLQDAMAMHFVGNLSNLSSPIVKVKSPKNAKGGSEYDNFNYSLAVLENMNCLLLVGFYYNQSMLSDLTKIVWAVMDSHIYNPVEVPTVDMNEQEEGSVSDSNENGELGVDELLVHNAIGGDIALTTTSLNAAQKLRKGESSDKAGRSSAARIVEMKRLFQDREDDLSDYSDVEDESSNWFMNGIMNLIQKKKSDEPVYTYLEKMDIPDMRDETSSKLPRQNVRPSITNSNSNEILDAEFFINPNDIKRRSITAAKEVSDSNITKEFQRISLRHDSAYEGSAHLCYAYENQRWFVTEYKLESTISRGPFSESTIIKGLFTYEYTPQMSSERHDDKGLISELWTWIDEWHIQPIQYFGAERKVATDPEGWLYAINWPNEFYPEKFFTGNVRRRRWERTQRMKSASEMISELLMMSTPEVLIKILRNKNIDSNGIINFQNVLNAVKNLKATIELMQSANNNTQTNEYSGIMESPTSIKVKMEKFMDQKSSDKYKSFIAATSQKCLHCCLNILLYVTNLNFDARTTFFLKKLFSLPQPIARLFDCTEGNMPFWHVMNDTSDDKVYVHNKALKVSLTPKGVAWLEEEIFGPILKIICIRKNKSFVQTMLRMLAYDDNTICSSVVRLMELHFYETEVLSKVLLQMMVLGDELLIIRFKHMRYLSVPLVNLMIIYLQSRFQDNVVLQLCKVFRSLHKSLYYAEHDFEPSSKCQNILRELGLYVQPVRVILHSIHTFMISKDSISPNVLNLWTSATDLLKAFVLNNDMNQKILMSHVADLLPGIEYSFPAHRNIVEIISTVFYNYNSEMSPSLVEKIVSSFMTLIRLEYASPQLLKCISQFLENVMYIEKTKEVWKTNQAIVLRIFLSPQNKSKIVLLNTIGKGRNDPKVEREKLIIEYASQYSVFPPNLNDLRNIADFKLIYHATCIRILALACLQRNNSNIYATKLQIPIEQITDVLGDELAYTCIPLVHAYGMLLYACFLDPLDPNTDADDLIKSDEMLDMSNLSTKDTNFLVDPSLWNALDKFVYFIGNDSTNSLQNKKKRKFLFDIALPCLTIFLENTVLQRNSDIAFTTDSAIPDKLYESVCDVLQFLLEGINLLDTNEANTVNKCAKSLNVSFSAQSKNMESGINADAFIPSSSNALSWVFKFETAKDESTKCTDHTSGISEYVKALLDYCPLIRERIEQDQIFTVEMLLNMNVLLEEGDENDIIARLMQENNFSQHNTKRSNPSATSSKRTNIESAKSSETKSLSDDRSPYSSSEKGTTHSSMFIFIVKRLIKHARETLCELILVGTILDNNLLENISHSHPKSTNRKEGHESILSTDTNDKINNVIFVFKLLISIMQYHKEDNNKTSKYSNKAAFAPKRSYEETQYLMNACHATSLIVEALCYIQSTKVSSIALDFGVLYLLNGNRICQESFIAYLASCGPETTQKFFKSIVDRIEYATNSFSKPIFDQNKSQMKSKLDENVKDKKEQAPTESKNYVLVRVPAMCEFHVANLFRFLQLLCEDHYLDTQLLMISQDSLGVTKSHNLILPTVELLKVFGKWLHILPTESVGIVITTIMNFLIECAQGPCKVNQTFLVHHVQSIGEDISTMKIIDMNDVQAVLNTPDHSQFTNVNREILYEEVRLSPLCFRTRKLLKTLLLNFILSLLEGRELHADDQFTTALVPVILRENIRERISSVFKEMKKMMKTCRLNYFSEIHTRKDINFICEEAFQTLSVARKLSPFNAELREVSSALYDPVASKHITFNSISTFKAANAHFRESAKQKRVFEFFDNRLRSIEIVWAGKGLFEVHFVKPRECSFLTEEIIHFVKESITISDDDKIKTFISKRRVMYWDMDYKMFLSDNNLSVLLLFQDELLRAVTYLSVVINFIIVVSLQKGYFTGDDSPQYATKYLRDVLAVLVVIQFILVLYKALQVTLLRLPLIYKEYMYEVEKQRESKSFMEVVSSSVKINLLFKLFFPFLFSAATTLWINLIVYYRYSDLPPPVLWIGVAFTIMALLSCAKNIYIHPTFHNPNGATWIPILLNFLSDSTVRNSLFYLAVGYLSLNVDQPYFNCLMMTNIIHLSTTLANVVKAVILPANALILSSILGCICIYIFTLFGFYFFPNNFYNTNQAVDECGTLLSCLITFLHDGLLAGGGIRDHVQGDLGIDLAYNNSSDFSRRVLFDVAFFVIVIILLLNIIFGIIIDTFGRLREEASAKADFLASYCFICGIPKDVFESGVSKTNGGTSSFAHHIKFEHNMWDYIFYLIYLKNKPKTEYTGVESFVAEQLSNDNLTWIPKGVALSVANVDNMKYEENENRLLSFIKRMTDHFEKTVEKNMSIQHGDIEDRMHEMRQMLHHMESDIKKMKG